MPHLRHQPRPCKDADDAEDGNSSQELQELQPSPSKSDATSALLSLAAGDSSDKMSSLSDQIATVSSSSSDSPPLIRTDNPEPMQGRIVSPQQLQQQEDEKETPASAKIHKKEQLPNSAQTPYGYWHPPHPTQGQARSGPINRVRGRPPFPPLPPSGYGPYPPPPSSHLRPFCPPPYPPPSRVLSPPTRKGTDLPSSPSDKKASSPSKSKITTGPRLPLPPPPRNAVFGPPPPTGLRVHRHYPVRYPAMPSPGFPFRPPPQYNMNMPGHSIPFYRKQDDKTAGANSNACKRKGGDGNNRTIEGTSNGEITPAKKRVIASEENEKGKKKRKGRVVSPPTQDSPQLPTSGLAGKCGFLPPPLYRHVYPPFYHQYPPPYPPPHLRGFPPPNPAGNNVPSPFGLPPRGMFPPPPPDQHSPRRGKHDDKPKLQATCPPHNQDGEKDNPDETRSNMVRCTKLERPNPLQCFIGNIGQDEDAEEVLDFHRLVNFPCHSQRRGRSKTVATKEGLAPPTEDNNAVHSCCVMCGEKRPGMVENARVDGAPCADSGAPIIIPKQNKGLCTQCDVAVWVVAESGRKIKWCKGCKNFKPWSGFGDKGEKHRRNK